MLFKDVKCHITVNSRHLQCPSPMQQSIPSKVTVQSTAECLFLCCVHSLLFKVNQADRYPFKTRFSFFKNIFVVSRLAIHPTSKERSFFPYGVRKVFFLPTWHRGGKCGELLRSPKTSPECGFVALRLVLFFLHPLRWLAH